MVMITEGGELWETVILYDFLFPVLRIPFHKFDDLSLHPCYNAFGSGGGIHAALEIIYTAQS